MPSEPNANSSSVRANAPPPPSPLPQPRPRLLAIDDDMEVHRLLKSSLRHERVDVHSASNGEQGLLIARALMPDVILLDMELPDADGFSLVERLKGDGVTQDIPVIFLSHAPDANMIIRALDAGAIDFVAKPFDAGELRARVRNAVRIRSLIKMLAQRAQIDGLTGLWNRAHFDQRLHEEIVSAVRHGSPLALVLCDLDHFKSVNDRFGHTHGDRVLEECARVLGGGRAGDVSCRYGGEEFAIILPRSSAADAAALAERLREAIRSLRWEEAPSLVVTATFGVAELEARGDATPAAMARVLIQRADAAMYSAKQAGRDRVLIAGADDRLRASA